MSVQSVIPFLSPAVQPRTYHDLKGDHFLHSHFLSPRYSVMGARTMVISACGILFMKSKFNMSLSGAIFCAVPLACGWVKLEYIWFIRAVRKAALAIFAEKSPVPVGTVTYMGTDPQAVKTLVKNPENLTKMCRGFSTGEQNTLLKILISNGRSAQTHEIWFEVFKVLAHSSSPLDLSALIKMISWHPICALYALEQKLVSSKGWSASDLIKPWHFVKDIQIMRALIAAGFEVEDAARARLAYDLYNYRPIGFESTLCGLFSLGAEPISPEEKFSCSGKQTLADPKKEGRVVLKKVKLKDLDDQPDLLAILKQAQESDELVSIFDERAGIRTLGPLVDIALSKEKFEIAKTILYTRFIISLIGAACIARQMRLPSRSFAVGSCFVLLASVGYYLLESWRATTHLRKIALEAFGHNFPSHAVTHFVSQDLSVVQKLSAKQLTKFDDQGYTLWTHLEGQKNPNFEIFKLVADQLFNKGDFFFQVVRSGHVKFVQYVLDNRPPQEIRDQFEMWRYVNSAAVAKFLKSRGFNLEVIGPEGMTPLHAALNAEYLNNRKIFALLAAGAKFDKTQVPKFDQLPYSVQFFCWLYAR